jgi:ferric-dicitrate binding protein FerR (iron transport regulator)
MENEEHLKILVRQFADGSISKADYGELMAHLKAVDHRDPIYEVMDEVWKNMIAAETHTAEEADVFYLRMINDKRFNVKITTYKLWPRIAAAAAILLVVGAGLFYYVSRDAESGRHPELVSGSHDVAPGKNTATITLANGKTIQLSDAKTGVIVGASGLKYNDGSAVGPSSRGTEGSLGHANSRDLSRTVEMTEVATPRGGQYQITLPDGTKVWLNAASNLSFPSTFQGLGIRKVELSGEAYFEVVKDKKHPFIVLTEKQEVEVLGTHFNINSYADETSTKTTLLEGSVRVSLGSRHLDDRRDLLNSTDKRSLPYGRDDEKGRDNGKSRDGGVSGNGVILKPGEQARVTTNNRIRVAEADLAEVTAWKNGDFIFKTEDFKTIMRKVARWYNVDIVFDASAPTNLSLGGVVSRTKNISAVLKIMEATGDVHFKIEGRRITVTK